ncbi:HEAT repeat domain-containing protein [Tsukamurella sp. 8F]|uniref:HEAT repeat domain-containing protein n=1 Tax=unclassified Tsukamurella TaxID=2633480 RepID=UPI0023B8FBD5|nr:MULTISPECIES: HEAT repeat domain-containing protein [unclassified Tsukamurella]MDF0531885.1 HEAT repeat domain-containing protein [Tsukamurella sp. 8J]MDF0589119.1 HEAT repeat domain-containing protein [Tsukamurella sp. 8F]
MTANHSKLADALVAQDPSTRLRAALAAGTHPRTALAGVLVARCAEEPDFYVRDMLTWALTRLPTEVTLPLLHAELHSETGQARSQALHTISKIADPSSWAELEPVMLRDEDDEVARSAWRAAVVLVPDARRGELAALLAASLGRGDRDLQRSLSRALVELGDACEPALRAAATSADPGVRTHAAATERLLEDPDAAFAIDVDSARRIDALGGSPC